MQTSSPAPTIGSARWCAVTGRHADPDGWYNTGHILTMPDPQAWICAQGARELAKWVGWIDPAVHAAVHEELAGARAQLDQAIEEISALRKFREQVNGLEAAGMKTTRSGGRPTRETRPEVIRDELEGTVA